MYSSTWKKYLPLIKLLLKRSLVTEQSVTLDRIDFEKTGKGRKPAIAFSIEIRDGRLNTLHWPVIAKELGEQLTGDPATKAFLKDHAVAITLGNDLRLGITRLSPLTGTDIPYEE